MRSRFKKVITVAFVFCFFLQSVFSSDGEKAFIDGVNAFSKGDWASAIFSFKQASIYDEYNTPETYYMLIKSEINAGESENASDDCDYYLYNFPDSMYEIYIKYLKGRSSFMAGDFDKAIILFSDLCHQYPNHELYASSLFWIAESFYSCYQYDDAIGLYNRIICEFPSDPNAPSAQFRIESIKQREREEKLIYLLKQTGEEYLVAREEYEKQLRLLASESAYSQKKKDAEATGVSSIASHEGNSPESEINISPVTEQTDENGPNRIDVELLRDLKAKAEEARRLLLGME